MLSINNIYQIKIQALMKLKNLKKLHSVQGLLLKKINTTDYCLARLVMETCLIY